MDESMPKKSKTVKPRSKTKVLKTSKGDWQRRDQKAVKKKHPGAGWPED
jgi:hypothetical protein